MEHFPHFTASLQYANGAAIHGLETIRNYYQLFPNWLIPNVHDITNSSFQHDCQHNHYKLVLRLNVHCLELELSVISYF